MSTTNHVLSALTIIASGLTISCKGATSTVPETPVIPTRYSLPPVFNPSAPYGTLQDQDNNTYKTIVIGSQTWMAENLKTTKYRDGTAIPQSTTAAQWAGRSTGSYTWFENVLAAKDIFGALYNWHAVSTGTLCPAGWHVPTDADWTTLTITLGGLSVAGGKLKEVGTTHWESPNTGATNSSGFTGLGSAPVDSVGTFGDFGIFGIFWSSTESTATTAWSRTISSSSAAVFRVTDTKGSGYSVRCLMDS